MAERVETWDGELLKALTPYRAALANLLAAVTLENVALVAWLDNPTQETGDTWIAAVRARQCAEHLLQSASGASVAAVHALPSEPEAKA